MGVALVTVDGKWKTAIGDASLLRWVAAAGSSRRGSALCGLHILLELVASCMSVQAFLRKPEASSVGSAGLPGWTRGSERKMAPLTAHAAVGTALCARCRRLRPCAHATSMHARVYAVIQRKMKSHNNTFAIPTCFVATPVQPLQQSMQQSSMLCWAHTGEETFLQFCLV